MAIRSGQHYDKKYNDVLLGLDVTGAPTMTAAGVWWLFSTGKWDIERDDLGVFDGNYVVAPDDARFFRCQCGIGPAGSATAQEHNLQVRVNAGAPSGPSAAVRSRQIIPATFSPRLDHSTPWLSINPGDQIDCRANTDSATNVAINSAWWYVEFIRAGHDPHSWVP